MTSAPARFVDAVLASSLEDFVAAAQRIRTDAVRSPLLPFDSREGRTIRLKAENVQPFGSFKIRCGTNALASLPDAALAKGVATASAGNFAQGLALAASRRSIPVTAHVPESAAGIKLEALEKLGVSIVRHSFAEWWSICSTRATGADDGVFIHPVSEVEVIRGNGTIGLELAQDWPELDTVVVPFGGGGLSSGIALALRASNRSVRIVACEAETSTPLASAMRAGQPVQVERRPSFIDGIGSTSVLAEMWPLLGRLIDDVIVVSLAEATAAVRTLALRSHLVVEGAAGVALAAALSPRCGGKNVAVILSGGNIDPARLREILA
ncbi:MAG: threonine ammonia-lyase [Steroidobacteraceae bacterium]